MWRTICIGRDMKVHHNGSPCTNRKGIDSEKDLGKGGGVCGVETGMIEEEHLFDTQLLQCMPTAVSASNHTWGHKFLEISLQSQGTDNLVRRQHCAKLGTRPLQPLVTAGVFSCKVRQSRSLVPAATRATPLMRHSHSHISDAPQPQPHLWCATATPMMRHSHTSDAPQPQPHLWCATATPLMRHSHSHTSDAPQPQPQPHLWCATRLMRHSHTSGAPQPQPHLWCATRLMRHSHTSDAPQPHLWCATATATPLVRHSHSHTSDAPQPQPHCRWFFVSTGVFSSPNTPYHLRRYEHARGEVFSVRERSKADQTSLTVYNAKNTSNCRDPAA
jgi:hypothetical protein